MKRWLSLAVVTALAVGVVLWQTRPWGTPEGAPAPAPSSSDAHDDRWELPVGGPGPSTTVPQATGEGINYAPCLGECPVPPTLARRPKFSSPKEYAQVLERDKRVREEEGKKWETGVYSKREGVWGPFLVFTEPNSEALAQTERITQGVDCRNYTAVGPPASHSYFPGFSGTVFVCPDGSLGTDMGIVFLKEYDGYFPTAQISVQGEWPVLAPITMTPAERLSLTTIRGLPALVGKAPNELLEYLVMEEEAVVLLRPPTAEHLGMVLKVVAIDVEIAAARIIDLLWAYQPWLRP